MSLIAQINETMQKFSRLVVNISLVMVTFFLAAMVVIVFLQIIGRYVLFWSLPWSEELSRYLMIWMAYIASNVALYKGLHVSMRAFLNILSEKNRNYLFFVMNFGILLFLTVVIFYGYKNIIIVSNQTTPVLGISMGWAYAAVPFGCLLMLVQVITNIFDFLTRKIICKEIFDSRE